MTLRKDVSYSPITLRALCAYSWPGNVRELINVVEREALLCESDEISTENELADNIQLPNDGESLPWSKLRPQVIAGLEHASLMSHLQETKGRIGETAKRTQLSTRTLFLMMNRHGMIKGNRSRKIK